MPCKLLLSLWILRRLLKFLEQKIKRRWESKMKHMDFGMLVSDKFKIYEWEDSHIEFEFDKLCASLIFFLCDKLSHINIYHIEKINEIQIGFGRKITDEIIKNDNGFFGIDENNLMILNNTKNILTQLKNNLYFNKQPLKCLFQNLLHEIGHMIYFLENIPDTKYKNLEDCDKSLYEERNNQIIQIKNDYNLDKLVKDEWYTDCEFYAEKFSYSNLHYFMNLYEHDGYFSPTLFNLVERKNKKEIGE